MIREKLINRDIGRSGEFRWRGHEISRIEGLSDAVFAFAITLLVVSLEVPKTFNELAETMHGFGAFLISFLLLFAVWFNQYKFFRRFLDQCDFQILRVEPWEWAPRATILPPLLRHFALFRSRYVAGGLRRLVALAWRAFGGFPFFCYWLWTFEAEKVESGNKPLLTRQSLQTAPKG